MEELTVQIQKPIIPPLVWNKEAVEQFVNDAISKYTGRVYTADMIDGAKKDRAKLNALEKQLADIKPAEPTIDTSKIAMLEKVRNVYEIIESDSVDSVTKNEILKSVIEKIIYDRSKDELKVYYYYAPESQ